MIKSDITAYIGSYALDGVIEIPSRVLTSTPQDEELNLTYTPNFQLKLNDSYGYFNAQCMKVDFTVDSYEYSAYMYKVNSAADGTVTVQYAGGLEQGETPEPEPEQSVAPTMYYDENTFTVSATGEGTVIMYLDETEIENPYTFEQTDEDATYIVAATAQQDGKTVSDIVSIDCFVPAASQPEEHTLAFESNEYSCFYDIYTGETVNSEFAINYDGEPIDLSYWSGDGLPLSGMVHCAAQETLDEFEEPTGAWEFYASYETVGDYSDTVEFTYNGLTAYTTVSVTIIENEPEPYYSLHIFSGNGNTEMNVPATYDISGQNPYDSFDDSNLTLGIPAMSSASNYTVKLFDENVGAYVELTENNFAIRNLDVTKSLIYWNGENSTWRLDLHDTNSQGLTAADFLNDAHVYYGEHEFVMPLPFVRPNIINSLYLNEENNGEQVIINLEDNNSYLYLVNCEGITNASGYYKDLYITDGTDVALLYNNNNTIATVNDGFASRSISDYSGNTLSCGRILIEDVSSNQVPIKWIAGTFKYYQGYMQIEATNLPVFTVDSNNTINVNIYKPENEGSDTSYYRQPTLISSGTVTSSNSNNGTVEFTPYGESETVTWNIKRMNSTSATTDTFNGSNCTLTGMLVEWQVLSWDDMTVNQ